MYDLAVIVPVRRGSSRIADRSMLPFGDQDSLIAWKLSQLVRVIPAERIYLSTEDEGFAAIGDGFGVSRHKRSSICRSGIRPRSATSSPASSAISRTRISRGAPSSAR